MVLTPQEAPELEPRPPRLSLLALFLKFLRFGALAFGGPIAQIGMIRQQLVEDERWLSPARFNRVLAVMQALPGPEAHELCVHLGMMARGRIGGLLAGLGFMLPGLALMLLAAWAYEALIAGRAHWAGALLGVQIVAVALVARAVLLIGAHALGDARLWLAAGLGFAATLVGAPFWIPLAVGGVLYMLEGRRLASAALVAGAVALAIWLRSDPAPAMTAGQTPAAGALALFVAGLKGGLLTFGGAYTAIPYLRADTVGRGWLSDGAFLDGVALAGVLPAPLIVFATFAGYIAGGWTGALAETAGVFLPAFAFSLILYERLEAIVDHPGLHRLLAGVAAAVVGVIAATALQLAWGAAARAPTPWAVALIALPALAAAWKLKGHWAAPTLVAAGAAAGWLAFGAGGALPAS